MKVLAALFFSLPFFATAQTGFKFHINGKIDSLANGSLVYITDVNNPTDTLAKGISKAGAFVLDGSVSEPNLHHINFWPAKKKALLFLDGGNMTLTGSMKDLRNVQLKGSSSHKDFVDFQKRFNPTFERLQKSTDPNSGVSFSNQDYEKLQASLDSFILAHKSSYVSPFILVITSQLSEDIGIMEKRYIALDENVKRGFYGKYVKEMIDDSKIGAVGSEAIDFTQNDTSGNPVSLSSFRGKYVLIDFWASWCGPCRMENPNVVAAYEKFKNKNFTILGVSLDRSRPSWIKAIADDNLTWTQVSDLKFWSNEAAAKYKVESIPQNYLVGPDGKIVARNLRGPALESKLCELFGCN